MSGKGLQLLAAIHTIKHPYLVAAQRPLSRSESLWCRRVAPVAPLALAQARGRQRLNCLQKFGRKLVKAQIREIVYSQHEAVGALGILLVNVFQRALERGLLRTLQQHSRGHCLSAKLDINGTHANM